MENQPNSDSAQVVPNQTVPSTPLVSTPPPVSTPPTVNPLPNPAANPVLPSDNPKPPKRKKLILVLLGLFFILAIATVLIFLTQTKPENIPTTAKTTPKATLQKIKVQLSWFNTAEFAGFYIAKDNGFFTDAGLDVELMEAVPPKAPAESLVSKTADFGVTGIDGILLATEQNQPMIALAAIYQQSPVTFITLKDSGIEKPEDFIGKRITIECGSNAEYPQRAMLKKLDLAKKITENCSTYNIDMLLKNQTDVFAGFVTNEPILLELMGKQINNILVLDYGINYYPNLIFTTKDRYLNDKETVKKFISATLKGYEYALAHPQEAVDATMKRKSGLGKLDPIHQQRTMSVQSPLIFTGKTPLGFIEQEIWEQGQDILLEQKIIKNKYDIKSVYTNEFIKTK